MEYTMVNWTRPYWGKTSALWQVNMLVVILEPSPVCTAGLSWHSPNPKHHSSDVTT